MTDNRKNLRMILITFAVLLVAIPGVFAQPVLVVEPDVLDLVGQRDAPVYSSLLLSETQYAGSINNIRIEWTDLVTTGTAGYDVITTSSISFNPDYIHQIPDGGSETVSVSISIPADVINETIYEGHAYINYDEATQSEDVPVFLMVRNPQIGIAPAIIDEAANIDSSVDTSVVVRNLDSVLDVLDVAAACSDLISDGLVIPSTAIDIDVPTTSILPLNIMPIGITINVAAGTAPGVYTGDLLIYTKQETFTVPVSLQVVNFVNIPRPFEVVRIDINSDKILDVGGAYSSGFSGAVFSGTIGFSATQDEKGKVFGDGSLVLDDIGSSFSLKGKLKMKAKTGELTIKLKGKGTDPTTGKKYKLKANGAVDDDLVLHFLYKGKGKGNKDEFDFSEPLVNPERGATVLFYELIGKGKKKVKKAKGSGELVLPYPQTRPELKIKEGIKKETKRNYNVKGFKFKLKLNTEESDDELSITKVTCKVGYGKIPVTEADIEFRYLPLE